MKNILVPTDFSGCAINAMDMGLALAEFFGATIHFFTTMDDTRNGEALDCSLTNKSEKSNAFLEHVNMLFQKWKTEAFVRKIKIKTVCSSGKLLPTIQDYIRKNDIDFIVMGSHGHSGVKGYLIGSNCQKIVRAVHIPVFIVKSPIQNYEFKNVIYASSFKDEEKSSFLNFLAFIEKFQPEIIHLVAINTTGGFAKSLEEMKVDMDSFAEICGIFKCEKYLYPDLSVESGIRHFAENIDANLVVISNHNRHPVQRIFSGSTVEALVQNCDLPVLSIDFLEEEMFPHDDKILIKKNSPM